MRAVDRVDADSGRGHVPNGFKCRGIAKIDLAKNRSSCYRFSEICTCKARADQTCPLKFGSFKIGPGKVCLIQVCPGEECVAEIRSDQVGPT